MMIVGNPTFCSLHHFSMGDQNPDCYFPEKILSAAFVDANLQHFLLPVLVFGIPTFFAAVIVPVMSCCDIEARGFVALLQNGDCYFRKPDAIFRAGHHYCLALLLTAFLIRLISPLLFLFGSTVLIPDRLMPCLLGLFEIMLRTLFALPDSCVIDLLGLPLLLILLSELPLLL